MLFGAVRVQRVHVTKRDPLPLVEPLQEMGARAITCTWLQLHLPGSRLFLHEQLVMVVVGRDSAVIGVIVR